MSGFNRAEVRQLERMLEIAEDVLAESPHEIRVGVNVRSEYDEYRRRVMAERVSYTVPETGAAWPTPTTSENPQ